MRLALLEVLRKPGRFAVAGGALTLLTLLLLFLGGLLDGLYLGSTGALRSLPDGAIVFSADSRESILRSDATTDQIGAIAQIDGVERAGGLGVTLLGVSLPGVDDIADGAVIGYELASETIPAPPPVGEAWADKTLEASGASLGDTIAVGPAGTRVIISGWVDDSNFLGQSGIWVAPETWRAVQNANRPDIQVGPDDFQAVVAQAADGVDPADLAERIDAASNGATSSLSTIDAANTLPGVAEQNTTFSAIIGTTFFVVGLVVALFFALLTLERVGLYAVLKAFGTPSRTLVLGVAVQALAVAVISFGFGALFTFVLSLGIPANVPVQFTLSRGLTTLVGITATAIIGGLVSLRRIISVDPATAIGAGV